MAENIVPTSIGGVKNLIFFGAKVFVALVVVNLIMELLFKKSFMTVVYWPAQQLGIGEYKVA